LECGYNINEPNVLVRFQRCFQLLEIYSVVLKIDSDQLCIIRTESVERADKGWVLADNNIALVAKYLCGQVNSLLSAGCDDGFVILVSD
jgi:hypothetical protein